MNKKTKQDVNERLHLIYKRAVQDKTGVSLFLTEEELKLIDEADIQRIKDESGYTAMCEESF